MTFPRISLLIPTTSWNETVAFWERLLGRPADVNDGGTWAQFRSPDLSIALVADDPDVPSQQLAVKLAEGADFRDWTSDDGSDRVSTGGHEERLIVTDPSGNRVVLYRPLPANR
ncbi:hypothetical protein SAMN05421505_12447 [Sinosporangium album]|uniref:VOC domain-containing protein n=1 Tax=Sinosporangium album TaxID=504805 RepID=A0A1G8FQR3_9ACTN|nr:hypothetical protein [Sinosporangium album]SDH84513.1 hypothetical protein SAMN05421505_12447 [Sinosporangium album]